MPYSPCKQDLISNSSQCVIRGTGLTEIDIKNLITQKVIHITTHVIDITTQKDSSRSHGQIEDKSKGYYCQMVNSTEASLNWLAPSIWN